MDGTWEIRGRRVLLRNSTSGKSHAVDLKKLRTGAWAETVIDFASAIGADGKPARPGKGDRVDEIVLLLPRGAELLVDDVLLYEPGE